MAQADASASFAVNLEDGTSGAAMSAATALQRLRDSISADTKELAALQSAMKRLQAANVVDIQQHRELKAAIDAKRQAIANAQGAYLGLGGRLTDLSKRGEAARSRFKMLEDQVKAMGGPLGGLAGRFGSLKELVAGGAIALGVAAIAAALVALVAATAAATVALLSYGVAQANARRSELLRLEGLTKLRSWMGIAAGNAGEMQRAIDQVSGSTALGRDKLAQYTDQLYRAGLRGQNLTEALEGAAIKASVMGDAAGSAFAGWAAQVGLAGGSVKALADDVRARFGGIAAKQLLDLNVQTAKLRESFARLFDGLRIEGLLKGLYGITSLFSQATASGRALRTMVQVLFQPLVNAVEGATPLVRRFFQGMIIGALTLTKGLLIVRNWFKRTFGASDILAGLDMTKVALYAGAAAFGTLVLALGVASVLFVGLGVALATFLVPMLWGAVAAVASFAAGGLMAVAPWLLLAAAVGAFFYAGFKLGQWLGAQDWGAMGANIVKGVVAGLKRGAAWLKGAMGELADSAMRTFKEKLGIASPSKVFTRFGLAIPQGVEAGIDRGTPRVEAASDRMLDAPSIPSEPAPSSGQSALARAPGAAPSVSVSIGDVVVHSAAKDAAGMVGDIRRELEKLLEGVAIQMGAPVGGA